MQVDSGTTSTDTLTKVTAPNVPYVNTVFENLAAYVSPTATITGYGWVDATHMNAFFTDYQALKAQVVALNQALRDYRQIVQA